MHYEQGTLYCVLRLIMHKVIMRHGQVYCAPSYMYLVSFPDQQIDYITMWKVIEMSCDIWFLWMHRDAESHARLPTEHSTGEIYLPFLLHQCDTCMKWDGLVSPPNTHWHRFNELLLTLNENVLIWLTRCVWGTCVLCMLHVCLCAYLCVAYSMHIVACNYMYSMCSV